MNRLRTALEKDSVQLFVSLPFNDAALARAAVEEGADGIKLHINVSHRASGNSFGPVEQYKDVIRDIRSLTDGPLGVVPGGSIEDIRREQIDALPGLGFDFYSIYAWHLPSFLLRSDSLGRTFAIDHRFDRRLVENAAEFGMEALEASIVPGDEYGTPFTFADALSYRWLVRHGDVPVIVPSQRRLEPEDVPVLKDCGIRAILLGAVVTGRTEDELRRAVSAFRNALDH